MKINMYTPVGLQIIRLLQFKINSQFLRMSYPSQMAEKVCIVMPKSVVRTISLEKLRQPSPLHQQSNNIPVNRLNNQEEKGNKKMYQKILDRKLSGKNEQKENVQKSGLTRGPLISKKLQQLKKQVDQKEMKDCTFKPQINPSTKNTRTVDQFFNDQLNYRQKKNDKVEEMRIILQNNRQKENIFRPNAMLQRGKKEGAQTEQEVHERLYQDSKNKDKQSQLSRQDSNQLIRDKSITSSKRFKGISRGNSSQKIGISNRKLSVASRQLKRQSFNTEYEQMSSQFSAITTRKGSAQLYSNRYPSRQTDRRKQSKQKRIDIDILQKKDNGKSQQIYLGKLMRQMTTVISKCNLPLVFSYMEMNLFFEQMNFIDNGSNSRKHLYEIWNMLQGQIYQEVSALSVMKVVYALMGCHNTSLVHKTISDDWLSDSSALQRIEEQLRQQGKKLSFKQNLLMLSQRDSKTLRQTFQELHSNRMQKGQSELLKEQKPSQFSFKPSLSKNTAEYAEKYRNRILCQTEQLLAEQKMTHPLPQNGQINHADLLMLDDKRKQALLQKKREESERQKRRVQDQHLNGQGRESSRSSRNHYKDRNHELFEMGKNVNQLKKDRSSNEVEEQKWKNQLTFKPEIKAKQNILQQLNSKKNFIPDYDRTIYRMKQARKSKQPQSRPSTDRDDSPLLYLNVVMEGVPPVKIPLYNRDNMGSITEKVRTMMDLDTEDKSGKLQSILKRQILPALQEMNLTRMMHE